MESHTKRIAGKLRLVFDKVIKPTQVWKVICNNKFIYRRLHQQQLLSIIYLLWTLLQLLLLGLSQ